MWLKTHLCQSVSFPALLACPAPFFHLATLSTIPSIILITSAFQDAVKKAFKKNFTGVSLCYSKWVSPYGYKKKFFLQGEKNI
jgi:hypothetical protein